MTCTLSDNISALKQSLNIAEASRCERNKRTAPASQSCNPLRSYREKNSLNIESYDDVQMCNDIVNIEYSNFLDTLKGPKGDKGEPGKDGEVTNEQLESYKLEIQETIDNLSEYLPARDTTTIGDIDYLAQYIAIRGQI